jgi:hypothetical protein
MRILLAERTVFVSYRRQVIILLTTLAALLNNQLKNKNIAQFRYLGTTVTTENLIQEEIKRRLNSGYACYHSVQNLLSSRLLSKNINFACGSI